MRSIFHKVSNLIFITPVLHNHFIDRETEVRSSATLLQRTLPEFDFTSVLATASSVFFEAKSFLPSPGDLVTGCSSLWLLSPLSLVLHSIQVGMLPHDCCPLWFASPDLRLPGCKMRMLCGPHRLSLYRRSNSALRGFYLLISTFSWGVYRVTETYILLICFQQKLCISVSFSQIPEKEKNRVPKAFMTS